MNTPEASIKDSLSNSHQGAVMSALGGFGEGIKRLFSEPAKSLSTVVSRLGVGPAALGIAAVVALAAAAPGQAQAQNMWSGVQGGGAYVTNNSMNDAFQQQRQVNFAEQATRVIGDQRGLSQSQQNLAGLASLAGGAFTKGDKAPIAAGVAGVAAAMLIPNQNPNQNQWGNGNNGNGGSMWSGIQGNNNGYYNQGNQGNYQQVNVQSQAAQQAFARYQQLAEPQFQIAVQANLDGNYAVRDKAIATFGNHWNAASQMGLPLHNNPDQVAKFQMLSRMNSHAMNYGLQNRAGQQQANSGYGLQ